MMFECPNMVANDVSWEGLVMLIMLIGLWECTTSLIMDIVLHELE